ncbi:hypothetical protein O6H91_08G055700 [Diphasiastrum complanatum]|uniref:Uncharacterized protein n=1 Tax=Diphasiastrum complanatum TaxID=34168 RepID=A0ACC2CY56_DIPCM|nr:hypothetical protein O6H91_08G055700 [Diphasiastrum complanatum]
MAWTPGGPLLTIGDLLEDLGHDYEEVTKSSALDPLAITSSRITSSSLLAQDDGSLNEIGGQSLLVFFEQTYNQLIAALGQSGNAWLGLTQKLCAALTTADKLVGVVHMDLGLLIEKIKTLEAILNRGSIAISTLQTAANKN